MNYPASSLIRAISRAGSYELPCYFRKDEVEKIINACDQKGWRELALIVDFLWKTGVRVSEMIKIKYCDMDPYMKTIKVITLKKSRKKVRGRKPIIKAERIIPIPDDLINRINLRRIETKAKNEDLIFPYTRSTIFRKVKKACLAAGMDTKRSHPHTFRHSFAVHLLRNGVPVTVVQRLLGHSSIENTTIYLAIVQKDVEEFVRKVKW